MEAPTPWRRLLYREMRELEVKGKVIDLGGCRTSGYHELLKGSKDIVVVNFDPKYGFDMKFNIESNFPLQNESCDTVLCINTLEHVYEHAHVIRETRRILKSGGDFIIAVPFLMFVHPCPNDYWRYTAQTLERLLREGGFLEVTITAVGKGPFLGAMQIVYPAFKFAFLRNIGYMIASLLDSIVGMFSKKLRDQYPLGYLVKAR